MFRKLMVVGLQVIYIFMQSFIWYDKGIVISESRQRNLLFITISHNILHQYAMKKPLGRRERKNASPACYPRFLYRYIEAYIYEK